ncbi:hypothetical protein ANN_10560 [Periplaneta americana]|uniref:Transposable element Tc3 transposase n=1 Tax=Periplaneta americana TaxID=6978 RepID=A0ABQ8TPK6_PERAM|nr:hypothetical protein ANN_10560 [Periplaneta americana]
MLEQWLVPQLRQDLDDDFIFQQDGAPPHFHNAFRAYLKTEMSDRWLGRAGDRVFVPPLPRDLEELKTRIREVAATVTEDMLKKSITYHVKMAEIDSVTSRYNVNIRHEYFRLTFKSSSVLPVVAIPAAARLKHLATYWGSVRRESYCVTTDTIVPVQQLPTCWEVHEEIHCVSEDDSHRRVDIIAINRRTQKAMVLDPTICFERDTNQALQINDDKLAKYVPCLPYLSEKYGISLYNWDVAGLLFGARGHVDMQSRNAYRVLVGRPEGKRPLGRPRRRWEDNIKMDLREVGYDDRDWINLHRIGTAGGLCEGGNEPSGFLKAICYLVSIKLAMERWYLMMSQMRSSITSQLRKTSEEIQPSDKPKPELSSGSAEDTPLINRQHIHSLHDGAPVHFSRTARRYLDRRIPDRWIGRGGPIAWPPRSPDLNPLDFYLWGHLKSLVYSSPVPDLESLRNRIVACSEDIRNTPGVWDRVRRSMRHRCRSVFKQEVDILNIFCNDNDLRKEKRSGEFQCCEGHNSEMKHFRTHVVMNYFDCLHVGNTYLKLCPVFLKHSVYLKTPHF